MESITAEDTPREHVSPTVTVCQTLAVQDMDSADMVLSIATIHSTKVREVNAHQTWTVPHGHPAVHNMDTVDLTHHTVTQPPNLSTQHLHLTPQVNVTQTVTVPHMLPAAQSGDIVDLAHTVTPHQHLFIQVVHLWTQLLTLTHSPLCPAYMIPTVPTMHPAVQSGDSVDLESSIATGTEGKYSPTKIY